MQDNALFTLLIAQINAGLTAQGMAATVRQRPQPVTQGTPSGPAVFLMALPDHRYGSPSVTDKYDPVQGTVTHTETQIYESTFQISAEVTQDPDNLALPTSKDLVNACAMIVQSEAFIGVLKAAGVAVLRVTDIRNPYFKDDRDRYQADPSFDFTVSHERVIMNSSPAAESVTFNMYRI